MINAKILADSLNVETGDRLTTFQVRLPKFLLAEVNTHRALSRNFASARAIPATKIRQQVMSNPFIPVWFGANQKGMQAKQELTGWRLWAARQLWLIARYPACLMHFIGEKIGLHKQIINRILEPWMWADGVVSATEWNNFFALRNHPDAQPEFRELAKQMQYLYESSTPKKLYPGFWHLPFVDQEDYKSLKLEQLKRVSAARCARVSYLLHDGKRSDVEADLKLCDRLIGSFPGHWSPLEHQATAMTTRTREGNFIGWKQFRKYHEQEAGGDYKITV